MKSLKGENAGGVRQGRGGSGGWGPRGGGRGGETLGRAAGVRHCRGPRAGVRHWEGQGNPEGRLSNNLKQTDATVPLREPSSLSAKQCASCQQFNCGQSKYHPVR